MPQTGRQLRLSVQTKVLIPVLVFLVLLPAITVWIINHFSEQEEQATAHQALATSDSVFRRLLEDQQRDLLTRYRNLAGDPRLLPILRKFMQAPASVPADIYENTIREFMLERLEDESSDETSVILYSSDRTAAPVGVRRESSIDLGEFARATAALSTAALKGESSTGTISLASGAFYVAAVPAILPENGGRLAGELTIGVRLGEAGLQELKKLTNTEILLLAGDRVISSTLPIEVGSGLLPQLGDESRAVVVVEGKHYLALSGSYGLEGGRSGVRYVLLSSVEESLQALGAAQRTLVGVSAIGVVLSAAAVWLFVRRIIRPLRELRDTAEAVGQGDFSRKVRRFSNDECGDLADAFNRMTANLQSSHAELEKTVETLKTTQAQLIQSEKLSAVGQFVAGVAHELNNPLAAVIGFSDLLCQTESDAKIRPHLELIAKSAHRCHKIVHNLLSFARQHPPERSLVQVNGTIDEVLEIMAYEFRTGNVSIQRDFQEDLPMIMADPHQLQQVFVNILGNARQAIDAFRQDGKIIVRTRAAGGFVRLEFIDNGPGIRPENLAKIFDPFFTTKPVGKGTGLGLSLSYGMIREHGGRISATSQVGNGATFVIELPVAANPSGRVRELPRPAARPKASSPSGKSVLVVDDEEWLLALARELLTNDGHAVETVLSGELAVAALKRRNFDVIVCDWKMPGLNGIQFYKHIAATDPAMAERVIFMSGDIINADFQEFLRSHERTCLPKPFAIQDFQNAVAAMLNNPAAGARG